MSKSLKRIRNFTFTFLFTYSLVLMLSTADHGQSNASEKPQIKGITHIMQGRTLTIPDFENQSIQNLLQYRRQFEPQAGQFPQLGKAQLIKMNKVFNTRIKDLLPTFLAIADNYWSKAEEVDSLLPDRQYVSGTVTCSGQNKPVAPPAGLSASYLELSDPAGSSGKYYGKRWVSGDQMVEGGCGILKAINNGKEPAGRLVWGTDTLKIVLNEANEQTQSASFSAYMRVCANLPLTGRTCTPYFIPLPWFSVSGKNWVVIGAGVNVTLK